MDPQVNLFEKIKKEGLVGLFSLLLAGIRSLGITENVCEAFEKKKKKSDELFAVYDLNTQLPGYNLVQFLLCVEHYCIKNGYKSFTLVVIPKELNSALEEKVLGESNDPDTNNHHSISFLSTLAILSPSCDGFLSFGTRQAARKFIANANVFPEGFGLSVANKFDAKLTQILVEEGTFCQFSSPNHIAALMSQWRPLNYEDAQIITITLRQSKIDPAGNSNISAWIRFAEYVQTLGYEPVIIPDDDQSFGGNDLFLKFIEVGIAATNNIGIRLHLYQKAFVNFYVPNGPELLAVYSTNINYICMKSWANGSSVLPSGVNDYKWIDPVALRPYWGSELQMWNGDDDTFDNIKKHFDEFCFRIKKRGESILPC
jgi:hypothetical protein